MQIKTTNKGFTLLEILLVIALIGILVSILLIAINPNRQLAEARNLNRIAHINDIYKALDAYSIKNAGAIVNGIQGNYQEICDTGTRNITDSLPDASYCNGKLDLRVLVPTYIASIPKDNQATGTGSTGYEIAKNNRNQISIRATKSELGEVVAVNAPSDTLYSKAGAFPSLDLNFASNKSLIDNVSGKNLITFARNSIGTYVGADRLIKTAAVNEPRFDHNPTTGESLGLLVEEPRENLMTGSDDFGPLYWVKLNSVGVSTNVTTSPDGTANADKFVENTDTSHKVLAKSFTLTANATYTFSIFVKSVERSNIMIHLRKSDYSTRFGGFFNLTTKTFTGETAAGGTLVSSSIIEYPNNWFRLNITGNIGANTAAVTTLYLLDTNNGIGYTGNGNSGIFLWGAQLEQGSFPTSYIPTSGDKVTRQADNVSITGANFTTTPGGWYNQNEGSIFTKFKGGRESQQNGYGRIISPTGAASLLSTNNFTNSLSIWFGGSAINFNGISNVDYWNVGNTASIAYNNTNTIIVKGGQSATGNIKPSDAGTINSWQLGGNNFARTNMLNGTISRLTYWPTRLPNSTLQSITQ